MGWSDFSNGKRENLRFPNLPNDLIGRSLELIKGDIRDLEVCYEACDGVEYVLHQAALHPVPRSVEDPCATNEVNVKGRINILFAAKQKEIKRVVYASSSSVYGNSNHLPQFENQRRLPISPYAV